MLAQGTMFHLLGVGVRETVYTGTCMDLWRPVLVLLACSGLIVVIGSLLHLVFNQGWRLAMLETFICLGALTWFFTEALGAFRGITFIGLASLWGITGLAVLIGGIRILSGFGHESMAQEVQGIRRLFSSFSVGSWLSVAGIILSALVLGLISFVAAPNTWDSMTYHLSRVMHWQQNQSLAFYATGIPRQLYLGPLAEVAVLNLQILAGNDHLANFVQYFAMIGCVIGATLITEALGGNQFARIFAALAIMTLPMGILQATSTQTDYLVGLWTVCFAAFVLIQARPDSALSYGTMLLSGISLGMAVLTKPTAIPYAAPLGAWLAIELFRRFKSEALKPLVVLLCAAAVIVIPHFSRNYELYHNPLGAMSEPGGQDFRFTNDHYSPTVVLSNVLRNTGIELASPLQGLNKLLERGIRKIHSAIGLDIDDPRDTWTGTRFRIVFSTSEDEAGNPLHLLLIMASLFLIIRYKDTAAVLYALCLAAGFLFFCLLLKWQPWNSRLLLPLFVLGMPLVAVNLTRALDQRITCLILLILAITATPYWLMNPARPLIGANSVLLNDRLQQYFTNNPGSFPAYNQTARTLAGLDCHHVGLITNVNDWEYPLWVMSRKYGNDIFIEHILVNNPSARYETGQIPCAIVTTTSSPAQEIEYQNQSYQRYLNAGPLNVFVPIATH